MAAPGGLANPAAPFTVRICQSEPGVIIKKGRDCIVKKLLQLGDKYRWNLEGIEFAIEERVGKPSCFIGRVEELEYLYQWAGNIQNGISRSIAFLGRRKIGKSLILERLYNILYNEQKGLIPFYYEFTEGERSARDFYRDFTTRFYMQVIGYYTGDIRWIRRAADKKIRPVFEAILQEVDPLEFRHKAHILYELEDCRRMLQTDSPPYEYVISAVAAPHGFATHIGVEERVVQLLDEFQYLNMCINSGAEKKPCKAYMSVAESRVAPLLITGSLMGVVSEELMLYLPHRFSEIAVPKMNAAEAVEMTMNYGTLYGHQMLPEIAEYIVHITNGIPGRIVEILSPKIGKPRSTSINDVDQMLEFEVGTHGSIKNDWDEYLVSAMNAVNDVNMRKITYFLCKNEGTSYYPGELKKAMSLDIDDRQLRRELELLYKYDIISLDSGRYGGVFDRTLKKVLMKNYGEILNLPAGEFDAYFRNDNMLDYLKERVRLLELGRAEARELKKKLDKLQGEHNNLKGHYYEREMLLTLIRCIIDDKGGLVSGIHVTAFTPKLNCHLETGEEIDIVLEGEQAVVMAECKNYSTENLDKITTKMADDFADKARRLHTCFPNKELRLGFFSRHGFEKKVEQYLTKCGIAFKI
ncbi:MAG: hypothetical protein DRI57_28750 [Deltaproteobacteria bacterium]|nr:MAG: hypothetical protein DRI57_28750 [Deltaproteobacteria bacterium]